MKHILIATDTTTQHPFNGPFPRLPMWESTRKVKLIWVYWSKKLLVVVASGESAPCSRQTATPLSFYSPDALPATKSTVWNYWRHSSK